MESGENDFVGMEGIRNSNVNVVIHKVRHNDRCTDGLSPLAGVKATL